MKCIKYISFSLLFFLIGIVGVKANIFDGVDFDKVIDGLVSSKHVCKYIRYNSTNERESISFKVAFEENDYGQYDKKIIEFKKEDQVLNANYIGNMDIIMNYKISSANNGCPSYCLYDEANSTFDCSNEKFSASGFYSFYTNILENENSATDEEKDDDIDLSGCIIDPGIREIIDWIMNLVRVGGIILLIVLGMLDFIKAAASGDQDTMKKSKDHFVKRLIACVALFLAPIFVDLILSLVNIAGGADEDCNSSPKPEVTEKKECWELGASDCSKRTDCSWYGSSCKKSCSILSNQECSKRDDCEWGASSGSSTGTCKAK